MKLLLDSNCWMEIIRSRPQEQEVRDLVTTVPSNDIFVTDFSVHSIGVAMKRHKVLDALPQFIQQTGIGRSIRIVGVATDEMAQIVTACNAYQLDFDDSYQYAAAELHGLTVVSFDRDFDRTPRGRLTPANALQQFTDEQKQQQQP